MDRYDFIRFGEQVGWYNESEDLMETMQVCCPVYPPVQGDTRVQLVSAGIEALQSGYGSEKTVRASQLVPFISHFGRGYWEALTGGGQRGRHGPARSDDQKRLSGPGGTDMPALWQGVGKRARCILQGISRRGKPARRHRVAGKGVPHKEADTVPGDGTGNGNNRIGHRVAEEAHRTQERRTRFKSRGKDRRRYLLLL